MNKTQEVRFTPDVTSALDTLKSAGYNVIILDSADEVVQRTACRYAARTIQARLFAPSNLDVDSDWQMAHFQTAVSEAYTMIDNGIAFVQGEELMVVAIPSQYNETVNGMTLEELDSFLTSEYGEDVELLFCGMVRQNKGRQAVETKIKNTLELYKMRLTK